MAKRLIIQCPQSVASIIVDALRLYAQMAFPDTGSPCQMVSRQALNDAADTFEKSWQGNAAGELSSRMRVMLKAALKTYFKVLSQQDGSSTEHRCAMLLAVIKGGSIDDRQWRQAVELDRLAHSLEQ